MKGIINVNVVAEVVSDRMVGTADANMQNYTEVTCDFELEPLFEKEFEELVDGPILTDDQKCQLYQLAWNHPAVQAAIATIHQMILDLQADQKEYDKGPMHYYGLKQSDFI